MTYLSPASFRVESLDEACKQLDLSDDEASDPQLTAAIARLSQRLDDYTDDHYEPEAGLVLTLNGASSGSATLFLPKRVTAVTQVRLLSNLNAWSVQLSTAYRFVSSLEQSGSRRKRENGGLDYLEIVPGYYLANGGSLSCWPSEANSCEVTGTFGWTTCPGDIKRLLALLVYDHFKPMRNDLRRADRWQTNDASFNMALTTPTGIPEADALIAEYQREQQPMVG